MEGKLCWDFDLPGFRFHPTEEELVGFYLRKRVQGQAFSFDIIKNLDLYRYDPWQLPDLAIVGEREWYFFVPLDIKCGAARRRRLTVSGFWKATGTDKAVRDHKFQCIGLKKTLVFYIGKAPRGEKTDWIMTEYRMPDNGSAVKKDIVLCQIRRKATSQKTLDQRALAGGGEDSMEFSAASEFQNDLELMGHESVAKCEGLPYLNEGNGEETMECMGLLNENTMKPPELAVPILSAGELFSPWIETWTPSLLKCTPREKWNNI